MAPLLQNILISGLKLPQKQATLQTRTRSGSQGAFDSKIPKSQPSVSTTPRLEQKSDPDLLASVASSFDNTKANKRKSRLGTTIHLGPKIEISELDRNKELKSGLLLWSSSESKKNPTQLFFVLKDGFLNQYASKQQADAGEPPPQAISVANATLFLNAEKRELRVILIEVIEINPGRNCPFILVYGHTRIKRVVLLAYQRESIIRKVAIQWGEAQKTDLEYEIAKMRKQLGQLWEMCAEDGINPKLQKGTYS
ncbi:hypothetical protein HDV01_004254 [Terramyces sp. JEL0728]|nr:hypothetical protein HDV01_004254 [Terramyces sp. JEL0728]